MIGSGKVKVTICQTYRLEQAEQAHRDLESRATSS
ncbi:MAG: zinc-binding dehydrogenase [Blastomonas sp.]|nr:zinc-binding dehydrogenase [Blastomonas sp.]